MLLRTVACQSRACRAFCSPFSVAVEGLALRACTLRSPGRKAPLSCTPGTSATCQRTTRQSVKREDDGREGAISGRSARKATGVSPSGFARTGVFAEKGNSPLAQRLRPSPRRGVLFSVLCSPFSGAALAAPPVFFFLFSGAACRPLCYNNRHETRP